MTLKVRVGGETSASEDEGLLCEYLGNLKEVLRMRAAGQFEQALFDRYNGSMVQLSDAVRCWALIPDPLSDGVMAPHSCRVAANPQTSDDRYPPSQHIREMYQVCS